MVRAVRMPPFIINRDIADRTPVPSIALNCDSFTSREDHRRHEDGLRGELNMLLGDFSANMTQRLVLGRGDKGVLPASLSLNEKAQNVG
jgi:hypothetical protein